MKGVLVLGQLQGDEGPRSLYRWLRPLLALELLLEELRRDQRASSLVFYVLLFPRVVRDGRGDASGEHRGARTGEESHLVDPVVLPLRFGRGVGGRWQQRTRGRGVSSPSW